MKKLPLLFVAAALMACSADDEENHARKMGEVELQITMSGWNGQTRASGDMLYPINILLARHGETDLHNLVTVASGTHFSISVPEGDYDLYAVCGLPTASIPGTLSDEITIPDAQDGGKADFAIGSVPVSVSVGKTSIAPVSISAQREMALLDLSVTNVPSSVASVDMFVQGLYETYSLDTRWHVSDSKKYTKIDLAKSAGNPTTYESSTVVLPCSNPKGMTFLAAVTTTTGYTSYLTYTSTTPMPAGTHLTQTIDYSQLTVEGDIQVSGWNNSANNGEFTDHHDFEIGSQYLTYPACVVYQSPSLLCLFPFKPMTVTLSDVQSWKDKNNIEYTLIPELQVSRWAFITDTSASNNIISMIKKVGLDNFNQMLVATGNPPIDPAATNILAMYSPIYDRFYCYDFTEGSTGYKLVDKASTEEFIYYPTGIIQLTSNQSK